MSFFSYIIIKGVLKGYYINTLQSLTILLLPIGKRIPIIVIITTPSILKHLSVQYMVRREQPLTQEKSTSLTGLRYRPKT